MIEDRLSDSYVEKEEIIAEADDSDYIHGEVYETEFFDEKHYYTSIIGTRRRWRGRVKITIEQIREKEEASLK